MADLFKQAMEDFPAFKKMAYVIWALIPIGGIFLFWNFLVKNGTSNKQTSSADTPAKRMSE